jgi:phage shock protein A
MEPTIKLTLTRYSEISQDIEKLKKVVEELYTKVYDQEQLIKNLEHRINTQEYRNS